MLTRDAILAAAAVAAAGLPFEYVDVPELGGQVRVQGRTGTQRDEWESSLIIGRGKRRDVNTKNVRAKLAVRSLVDEAGVRLFTEADADVLGQLSAIVLDRIYAAAQRVNGVRDEDVDELGKSSGAAAGSGSPTN